MCVCLSTYVRVVTYSRAEPTDATAVIQLCLSITLVSSFVIILSISRDDKYHDSKLKPKKITKKTPNKQKTGGAGSIALHEVVVSLGVSAGKFDRNITGAALGLGCYQWNSGRGVVSFANGAISDHSGGRSHSSGARWARSVAVCATLKSTQVLLLFQQRIARLPVSANPKICRSEMCSVTQRPLVEGQLPQQREVLYVCVFF